MSTCYSDGLHNFSVIIPRCYKNGYVNSFFPRTTRLRNSFSIKCFPLIYNLSGFKSRINTHLYLMFFLNRFPVCFNLFTLLFLVTPCLVVAVQPEWRESKVDNIHIFQLLLVALWFFLLLLDLPIYVLNQ